ncbi:cg2577-pa [Stylonychia lemnae]|uniref:Casein kinase I n=1 Tax=Stylonychia lemnae TaxID=5949 RepID=A0A078B8P6_STYLE|nr:cg2577-pa [Stylonychia lemnae]|eukprot:CDW90789.1 cg2577-pa [Stylonychia lemnae]
MIEEKYQILNIIGTGAVGKVWEIQDVQTGTKYALKQVIKIYSSYQKQQIYNLEFKTERVIYQKLQSKNAEGFPQYIGSRVTQKDKAYIILEKMGPSLARYLESTKRKLSMTQILQIGIQLVKQIEQLHAVGYIHRDIKLDNILLKKNTETALSEFQISLVDFGACRKYLDSQGNHIQKVQENSFQGNLAFASLNQMLCYGFFRNLLAEVGKIKFDENPDYASIIQAMQRQLLEIQQSSELQKWRQSSPNANCHLSPSPFTDSHMQSKRQEASTQENTPRGKQQKTSANSLFTQDLKGIVDENIKMIDYKKSKVEVKDAEISFKNKKQKNMQQNDYQSHAILDYELNLLSNQNLLFITQEKIDEGIFNFQLDSMYDKKENNPFINDQTGINLKQEHSKLQFLNKKIQGQTNQQHDNKLVNQVNIKENDCFAFENDLKQINRLEMNNDFQLQCLIRPPQSQQNDQIKRLMMIDSTDFDDMEINEEYQQKNGLLTDTKIELVYEFDNHTNNLKSICHSS